MMERWWGEDRRFRSALVASLFLHALLMLLIPTLSTTTASPDSLETISFSKIQHVSVQAPHPAVAPRHPANLAKTAVAPKPAARAAKPRPSAPPKGRGHAPRRPAPTPGVQTPVHDFAVAKQAGTPSPQLSAAPARTAAAPEQTAAPVSAARKQDQQTARSSGNTESGGAFALGDTHDATLDPAVSQELRRRFKMHVELLVYVSDDGKTQRVEFRPSLDADTERQIRDLLKDAHWDAAVCGGGLTCESKNLIKLVE